MSEAVKAVVGVVLIVVGVITYEYGGAFLVNAGAALLLNAAASLFVKAPRAVPLAGIGINYSGTLEPRRIIYGTLKVGGINCLPPLTSGPNNDFMHQVLAFGGEQISGFGDVYFNQARIANADIGAVTGSGSDGLVGGSGPYNGKAWIRRYSGSQTVSDVMLGAFSAWDSTHVGFGIPYAAITLQWDQNVYSSGFPQISVVVKGKKLYDPRLDSTNGGSGSQRYATPSTWTYSANPALCLRDYLTSALGMGEAQTRIDDTLVAAAANICDQTCAVPIPVLIGLTNWQNGSPTVTGVNTSFLAALTSGAYLKAPNGSMLQISGVPADDQTLTLLASYGGATASGKVTQYNNAGNATTTTQSRYTCNTLLIADASVGFNANITTLAGAMMGTCLPSAGKWRMNAGAWSGAAFTLGPDDIVGSVNVQCGTPRQNVYNAVRGNFIDPQSNYAPTEFPPIINAGYAAADGETIYMETNFPCCVDRFEAQRNAIIFNRQGRNQKTVTVQYGMSAFGVKVYETGAVTIPEIGWNAQSVRCTAWRFNPQGTVDLTLQEAYSGDFTDPAATDYLITGVNVGPPAGQYVPYPPTNLVATSLAGGINFKVTLPAQKIPGTRIQIFEYTASTPFSSSVLIAEHAADNFFIPKFDTVTRYYWARTLSPNEKVSTTFPATTGVAGVSLSASQVWDPIGNLLSTSAWVIGSTGSQGNYAQINTNTGGANAIRLAGDPSGPYPLGPFGHTGAIWQATGGTGGSGSVGFRNAADLVSPPIDPTKTYRVSVWIQNTGAAGAGGFAFGTDNGGGTVKNISPGTVDTNPYFCYGAFTNLILGQWYLCVGIIHASSYTGADSGTSGIYDPGIGDRLTTGMNGFANGANVATGVDFKFTAGALGGLLRISCDNSNNGNTSLYYSSPRFEMLSGMEPSIRDLLYPGVVDPTVTPRQIIAHTGPVPRHGILPTGNIPPMVQNAAFTYTSTTTTLTWVWTAYTVYRPDGSSFAVTASSQAVTGLTASNVYSSYGYSNESAPSAVGFFVGGGSGAVGSPAICYPAAATYAQLAIALAAVAQLAVIFQGKVTGSTTAAGTGGGGGGGGGFGCPHPDQQIDTVTGSRRAGMLRVGDELMTPTGPARIMRLDRKASATWISVEFHNGERVTVTPEHRFIAPDGAQVRAHELRLGAIIAGGGVEHLEVVALRLRNREAMAVVLDLDAPHLYLLTRNGPLCHNLKP